MTSPSSNTSAPFTTLTEFGKAAAFMDWHRIGCRSAGRAYRASVEDPIRDFPVFSMIESCCATVDESRAAAAHRRGVSV